MNKLIIIGNLTREPELRTTESGIAVCNFTVAVNRRSGQQELTDYFRVSCWRQKAESCAKYLHKGSRVCCWGPVSVRTYQANDGSTRASLEMQADEVEFCGGARQEAANEQAPAESAPQQFTQVDDDGELPF